MPNKPIDLLFSAYRRQVLGLLLLRPQESLHVREIARLTGIPAGSLHRELRALTEAGLLLREPQGNRVHYRANRACPVFEDLARLFRKSADSTGSAVGLADRSRHAQPAEKRAAGGSGRRRQKSARQEVEMTTSDPERDLVVGAVAVPRAAVEALARRYHIRRLALFGSAARGALEPDSDIDLLVEFEPGQAPSLWAENDLEGSFSRLFGGRRVDIAPPGILRNPYRRSAIERDLKVLYEAA